MEEDRLAVAGILKPQGICGEVKAKVYLDSADSLKDVKRLYIDGREYDVLHVRGDGDMAYISLKGVADRNAAELLRGKEMEAARKDLPEPPEGSYYIADLLGCTVLYESGETVGTVSSVVPSRTTIYYLDTPKGELSFAAADGVILDVNTAEKKITVSKKRFKEVSL